jgi:lipopolysaccharide/colanic/teichoic acid biosynthesis glycosyltransferase
VIRKHSIDEMPQFINVFLGQMSLVGPRPPLPNEVAEYSSKAMKRLTVKPGLTGYWQTRGRSDLGFEKMVDLDLEYIRERSFFADIRVIMRTVAIVFNGNGAR